jgi:GT2 family glycosyltransferase
LPARLWTVDFARPAQSPDDPEALLANYRDKLLEATTRLNWIQASRGWKLLRGAYRLIELFLPRGTRRRIAVDHAVLLLLRAKSSAVGTWRWLFSHSGRRNAYTNWIRQYEPGPAELAEQRRQQFSEQPLVSILLAPQGAPPDGIIRCVRSVQAQTYASWELCVADDGPGPGDDIHAVASADRRIRWTRLPPGTGTVQALNAAFTTAAGAYVTVVEARDLLAPFALFEVVQAINERPETEVIYSDEDSVDETGMRRSNPRFKPDWSPDLLRSCPYLGALTVYRRRLLDKIGGFNPDAEGAHGYDLALRATEAAQGIVRIPKVLYHRCARQHNDQSAPAGEDHAPEPARRALAEHLKRLGIAGQVQPGLVPGSYRIAYAIFGRPLVSIIIPNRDCIPLLAQCVRSVEAATHRHFEIIIAENNSQQTETFDYYRTLERQPGVRVLRWGRPFNYAAINNFAAAQCQGDVLLFLNNDVEALRADWIERLLEHALRPEVGAVGAKLFYPDGSIQHGGVMLGYGGHAGHCHRFCPGSSAGYCGRLAVVQNFSAVTGACLMMRRSVFEEVGGFDEDFVLDFNDVDLCLRIRQQGYWVVWTPHALLCHHECKTRGRADTFERRALTAREAALFTVKWCDRIRRGDPFYSPNLSLEYEDFSLKR